MKILGNFKKPNINLSGIANKLGSIMPLPVLMLAIWVAVLVVLPLSYQINRVETKIDKLNTEVYLNNFESNFPPSPFPAASITAATSSATPSARPVKIKEASPSAEK